MCCIQLPYRKSWIEFWPFLLSVQLQHMPGEPDIEIGYRLLIPVVHVGALIGRGGEAIAQLRQRTGARVKVHEPHDSE